MFVKPRLSLLAVAALLALTSLLAWSSTRPALAEPRPAKVLPGETQDALRQIAGARDPALHPDPDRLFGLLWAGVRAAPPAPEDRPAPGKPADPLRAPTKSSLLLSVPELELKKVVVPNSSDQAVLDRAGIMHLAGTGFPRQQDSNTYIAGHALSDDSSRVPHVFRDLEDLRRGDRVVLRDRGEGLYLRGLRGLRRGPLRLLGDAASPRREGGLPPDLLARPDLRAASDRAHRAGSLLAAGPRLPGRPSRLV